MTDEFCKAVSDAIRGSENGMFGKTQSKLCREVNSKIHKGQVPANKGKHLVWDDNVGLIFCQGTYTDVPLKITLTPSDATRYQETEFGFSTNSATQKYTYVEPGKFYKLHPATLGSSGPTIGVGFPAFEEGVVKEE